MKDDLGERIKRNYENRTRFFLPRRTYTIIRLDGKAFHSYTKQLKKPFDHDLSNDLDSAVMAILPEIQGAQFAYVQSDEISILLTDFAKPGTSAWFDGNIQKISSVSASLMTAEFNKLRILRNIKQNNESIQLCLMDNDILIASAFFDSRVFTIPDRTEVMNYFIWRNNDAARNSISMVAQSEFSHKELQGKSSIGMIRMLENKGIRWDTYDPADKNGRIIVKESYESTAISPTFCADVIRHRWVKKPAWKFTQDMSKLLGMIPKYE